MPQTIITMSVDVNGRTATGRSEIDTDSWDNSPVAKAGALDKARQGLAQAVLMALGDSVTTDVTQQDDPPANVVDMSSKVQP